MSSGFNGGNDYPPSFATDGNEGTFTHTNLNTAGGEWWRADFPTPSETITSVQVVNRANCCQNRLSHAVIAVWTSGSTETYSDTFPTISLNNELAVGDSRLLYEYFLPTKEPTSSPTSSAPTTSPTAAPTVPTIAPSVCPSCVCGEESRRQLEGNNKDRKLAALVAKEVQKLEEKIGLVDADIALVEADIHELETVSV
jgi:hypothetical protein